MGRDRAGAAAAAQRGRHLLLGPDRADATGELRRAPAGRDHDVAGPRRRHLEPVTLVLKAAARSADLSRRGSSPRGGLVKKILVIDDSDTVRQHVRETLAGGGYDIIE